MLALAALTGALTGLAVSGFEQVAGNWLLEWTVSRATPLAVVTPVAGIVLATLALRFLARGASGATADAYLDAYHRTGGDLPAGPVGGRMAAATATLGLGGSLGFEGPSIYLGAAIGSFVRRRFPRLVAAGEERTLLVAGAAAGVAAIFKAPATGAVFALEVPYQEDTAAHAVGPAVVAAASSYLVYVAFHGTERIVPAAGVPALDARTLVGALIVGLVAGIGARGFAAAVRAAKHLPERFPATVRIAVAGTALVGLGTLAHAAFGEPLTLGSGLAAIEWTETAERSVALLVALLALRAAATTCTLAAGGVGGVFIPLFVEGWVLGAAIAELVGSDTMLLPVIGAAAFLGAGYRTPIAAVVFVAERTGRAGYVVPALLAVAVAQILMGSRSVSGSQLPRRSEPTTPAPPD